VRSGPRLTEGGMHTRHGGTSLARSASGTAELRSSPAKAREEEAVSVRGSTELGWWRRGGVMAVQTFTSRER
jgi:hypothetical protein